MKPCKIWTKCRSGVGYGQRQINKVRYTVHRLAWQEAHGPIPKGMFVCHHCDNRACYEVTHLFLGTPLDNMRDMIAKGRARHPLGERNHARLTDQAVIDIRRRVAAGETQTSLAREYGVHNSVINRAVNRITWRHVP